MHVHVFSPDGEAKFWLEPQIELALNKGLKTVELTESSTRRGIPWLLRPKRSANQQLEATPDEQSGFSRQSLPRRASARSFSADSHNGTTRSEWAERWGQKDRASFFCPRFSARSSDSGLVRHCGGRTSS
jgi:hypothetical protein